jgi:hypothetical protein
MFYRIMNDVHTRIVVCCYHERVETDLSSNQIKSNQISSNSSMIAADNNTGMYIIHYSIEHIAFPTECTLSTTIVILI